MERAEGAEAQRAELLTALAAAATETNSLRQQLDSALHAADARHV